MRNIIIFLVFIIYATFIFFIETTTLLLVVLLLNSLAMVLFNVRLIEAIENIIKILPFIILTVVINCILANYQYAILVAIKLMLVCNITYIYSKTITIKGIANTIKNAIAS